MVKASEEIVPDYHGSEGQQPHRSLSKLKWLNTLEASPIIQLFYFFLQSRCMMLTNDLLAADASI